MSQSVLITIARQSIEEVLQAERKIDRPYLLENYPVLTQPMRVKITFYLGEEIRGSAASGGDPASLLEEIIDCAKFAAFEDERFNPLIVSEYLRTSVELTLYSPEGELTHKDLPIFKE